MGFNLKQFLSLITSPSWRTEEYTDSELEEMMNAGDEKAAQQETQNANSWEEEPVRDDSGWVADPGLGLNDYEKLKESFASQAYAELVQKQKDEAAGKTIDESNAQPTEEGPEAFLNAVGSSYGDLVNQGEGYVPTAPVQADGISVLDRIGLGLKSSGQKAAADTYMLADT